MKKSRFLVTNLLCFLSFTVCAEVSFERAGFDVADYWAYKTKFIDKEDDGYLDILSSNGSNISIYERLGNGYVYFSRENVLGKDFVVHDVNNDGYEDVIAYPYRIYLNDGYGHYRAVPSYNNSRDLLFLANGQDIKLQKSDVDSNGQLDLIFTIWHDTYSSAQGYGFSGVIMNVTYDNKVEGNFSYERVEKYTNSTNLLELESLSAREVVVSDLNNDGYQDLVYVNALTTSSLNRFSGSVVALNDGHGNFNVKQYISEASDIEAGDLDNDGDLDLYLAKRDHMSIIGTVEAADEVWLNNGDGSFIKSEQNLGEKDSLKVALSDLDGDGDLDAFVANQNRYNHAMNQPHVIWLNDGDGNFKQSVFSFGGEHIVRGMEVVDIDQDGDSDIVVLGGSEAYDDYRGTSLANNQVWLNQLVPNDVSDASYQEGMAYCQLSPADCGLYVISDLELAYEGGFDQGKESCALNPASCDLFSIDDLEAAKNEGEKTGFNNGQAACISDPETCDLFDQDDLEEAYEIGVTDGNQQCIDDPAYCGLFNQTDVDNIVETEKTALLNLIVQNLPRGIIVSRCKKNPQSPLCEFVDIKRDKKKAKRTKKQKKQTS